MAIKKKRVNDSSLLALANFVGSVLTHSDNTVYAPTALRAFTQIALPVGRATSHTPGTLYAIPPRNL
jgi:hypothetical protein